MERTITTLRKDTKFGYTLEAQFIQDRHDQGGVTYELRVVEDWNDGHFTYPRHSYTKFRNKEEGNREFLRLKREGYKVISKETIKPIKMDMR